MANQERTITEVVDTGANDSQVDLTTVDMREFSRTPERFAEINRLISRDLNSRRRRYLEVDSKHLTHDDIKRYLINPEMHERDLRRAVNYLYGASSHFRRLIQYFVALSDLSYVIAPYRIDTATANVKSVKRNFRKTMNLMSALNPKDQFAKILTVCMREDVFYGTIHETADSCIIQQLPADYCAIAVIEDNVMNVSFNFSFFDSHPEDLALFPSEFTEKYTIYKSDKDNNRWQELSAPNSFAIKCNKDNTRFAMPPLAGILREIFDIEDYKALKKTKTDIENYAMVVMTLGVDSNGRWQMDLNKAKEFYHNLDNVLPEEIGSVLSPMPVQKISFERNHTGDSDTVADAEQNLFTAAGVSSLLFNNEKASSNALLLSIKADQAITYGIVKSIETMVNRFVQRHSYGKNFRVSFIDSSVFNRDEVSKAYLQAAQYGMPTVSYYLATNGISQDAMDGLNFLEDTVLDIKSRFNPLRSSSTTSSSDTTGRAKSDIGDLSDSGEISQERDEG